MAARDLVDGRAGTVARGLREVTYVHLLLPAHQVVFANAIERESFHRASAALGALDEPDRARLLARLPDGAGGPEGYRPYVRRVVVPAEAAILRHGRG